MWLPLRDERGFTLIEVVVVTMILGILVGIVIGTYYQSSSRAIDIADRANLRVIRSALEQYRAASSDLSYPEALDDLYPGFVRSKKSLAIPGSGDLYEYDPVGGTVHDPDHPDR